MFVFTPCVTLCRFICRTALLYLGQVAIVNENLFSTWHSGLGHSGLGHPGLGHSGLGHPGIGHPGLGHCGIGHPGIGHRGLDHRGIDHCGIGYHGIGYPGIGARYGLIQTPFWLCVISCFSAPLAESIADREAGGAEGGEEVFETSNLSVCPPLGRCWRSGRFSPSDSTFT
uniref:Uncharacterized protein n=1 Tax=Oncorhynchus kisutch TaxID=8019 RepID=A0A8C7KAW6_ONCKI